LPNRGSETVAEIFSILSSFSVILICAAWDYISCYYAN
jgi:hypothetical protein